MEREDMISVPYIVHESVQVRLERIIKRLVIALVLVILLMFASNALWLRAWMQYDYQGEDTTTTTITRTIDVNGQSGTANYIGGSGVINGSDSGYYDSDNAEETGEAKD